MTEQDFAPAKLGIIAGGGNLPARLVQACRQTGREVFVLAIENSAEQATVEDIPHAWVRLGAINDALAHLRNAGVQELVLAGKIERPQLASLKPDIAAAKLLARLGKSFFQGDDKLLTSVIAYLEEEGFRVIGVETLLTDLLTPEGPLGQHIPTKQAQDDILLGAQVARAIGGFDIGQAVIVHQGRILGVEGPEGTDALLERCALLRDEPGGVLIKASKPQQERRVDLPTIGTTTLENLHRLNYAGVALEAGASLIIDRRHVSQLADRLGLFVLGFSISANT